MLKANVFPEYADSTTPFSSIYWPAGLATLGQLINVNSNSTIYRDILKVTENGRKIKKNVKI
jgi:hypothetical protein